MKSKVFAGILVMFSWVLVSGCVMANKNAAAAPTRYTFTTPEAQWIRNGEPLQFENQDWYPQDSIDVFTDDEVTLVGKYKDTEIFVDNIDVRPFDRLYTKFGNNKFRVFKLAPQHDQSSESE